MIIIRLRPHMAGLRPAGSHCESSGWSDGTGWTPRVGVQNDVQKANAEAACGLCRAAAVEAAQRIAPQKRSLLCPLSERRCRHPLLFAVLDLLVLLDQDKST